MTGLPSPRLVACATCGGVVSRRAPRCPHCGEEWPGRQAEARAARRDKGLATWQVALIVGTVVVVVIGAILLGSSRDFVAFEAGFGRLAFDGDAVGDFALGGEWDAFERRNRPFAVSQGTTGGRTMGLGWVCLENGLHVVLYLGGFYEGDADRDIEVRHRFDDEPASDVIYWRLLSDNESAFLPSHQYDPFTQAARAADSVAVRARDPFDGEVHTVAFGLSGLDDVLARLAGCEATSGATEDGDL